jgi:hypothetical protein
MSDPIKTPKYGKQPPMRSLENYIQQHKEKFPSIIQAQTLTAARRIVNGTKRRPK